MKRITWIGFVVVLQLLELHTVTGQSALFEDALTVAVVEHAPWSFRTPSGWDGFIVDMLNELGTRLNFTYSLQQASGNQNGQFNDTVGRFGGLIGDVMSSRVDLGISDLPISDPWTTFVTVTKPFLSTGTSILIRRPSVERREHNAWLVLAPFSPGLWALVLCTLAGWFIVTYIRTRTWCPGESKQQPRLAHCLKGACIRRNSFFGRILRFFWLSFVAIFMASYIANMACLLASFTTRKMSVSIESFQDLSQQTQISYGGWIGMTLNLHDDLQRALDTHISGHNSYYKNLNEAVSRVRDKEKPFAAIVQTIQGERLVRDHCDLMMLEDQLFITGYGILCAGKMESKGDDLCETLSFGILNLLEAGIIEELRWKWLTGKSKCPDRSDADNKHALTNRPSINIEFKPLSVENMALVFVLPGLMVLVFIINTMVTLMCRKTRQRNEQAIKQEESEQCL